MSKTKKQDGEQVAVSVRFKRADHDLVAAQAERDGSYSLAAWVRSVALRAAREGAMDAAGPGYGPPVR